MFADWSLINALMSLTLLVWPASRTCICPPCLDSALIIQQSHHLHAALDFAHHVAEDCSKQTFASLFWWGFCCGAVIFGTLGFLLGRCTPTCRARRVLTKDPSSPVLSPQRTQVALGESTIVFEPLNPNSLKLLGLAR